MIRNKEKNVDLPGIYIPQRNRLHQKKAADPPAVFYQAYVMENPLLIIHAKHVAGHKCVLLTRNLIDIYILFPSRLSITADPELTQTIINIDGFYHVVINLGEGDHPGIIGYIRCLYILLHKLRGLLHVFQTHHPGRHGVLCRRFDQIIHGILQLSIHILRDRIFKSQHTVMRDSVVYK